MQTLYAKLNFTEKKQQCKHDIQSHTYRPSFHFGCDWAKHPAGGWLF